MLPTKKGIMLSLPDWELIVGNLAQIEAALEQRDTSFEIALSGTRRVTISEYRNSASVMVREWYGEAGDMKPGKSGISLQPAMLEVCCA